MRAAKEQAARGCPLARIAWFSLAMIVPQEKRIAVLIRSSASVDEITWVSGKNRDQIRRRHHKSLNPYVQFGVVCAKSMTLASLGSASAWPFGP